MEKVQETICKVAMMSGQKVLLLKRSKWVRYHRGRWDLPGGAVDEGETQIQAAARECEEEAGIKVALNDLSIVRKGVGLRKGHSALRVCFEIELLQEITPRLSFEHSEYKWMTKDELLSTDLPDFYKESCLQILG